MNRYKFIIIIIIIIINESSRNVSFKPDVKLSTNKICQFLENIVIRCEIAEQNPNGYCDADFEWNTG
jgi:hypothetical protein